MNINDDSFRGRFEIRRQLGKGGMGEVHLAFDTYSQREVAIKLVALQAMDGTDEGRRMRRIWLNETRLAGKLCHPHIVQTYEAGMTDGYGYLVMEYVPGGTLRKHVTHDTLLPSTDVIEILYKVCNALDYAGKLGILHRDIKPANIMLSDDNAVKVADFGACWWMNAEETQVFDVGTLPYMPPEHFERKPPTIQSDIYAVGVTAYELLTGRLPYDAVTTQSLVYQKLHQDFIPIEKRRNDIPQKLRATIHRALHRESSGRYQTWSEFCNDLSVALPQLGLPAEVEFDSSRFQVLRTLPFCVEFTDAQLWETIHMSAWLHKSSHEEVCSEGSEGKNIYLVISGDAVVSRAGVPMGRLGAGDCFGEIAYLDEGTHIRTATVAATQETVLIEIDADLLRQATEGLQAAFGRAFMRLMVARVKQADDRFMSAVSGTR